MDHSPLGKLPTELRLEIFEYVLFSADETGVLELGDNGLELQSWMTATNRRALTMVCGQIRAETFPRFYGCNKITFYPMILDEFQPGFFLAKDDRQLAMIWQYLGPPQKWQSRLADVLDHMGLEIRRNVTAIDIHIGIWDSTWGSLENPLTVWLTTALATTARWFEGSGIQVNLCFLLRAGHWTGRSYLGQLAMPLSDIAEAHDTLDLFVRTHRSKYDYERYPQLSRAAQVALESTSETYTRTLATSMIRSIEPHGIDRLKSPRRQRALVDVKTERLKGPTNSMTHVLDA